MKYFPHDGNSPVADALREAGFVPLPRLWVKPEDIQQIKTIAFQYAEEVNRIRYEVKGLKWIEPEIFNAPEENSPASGDPMKDPDAAWAHYEEQQKRKFS